MTERRCSYGRSERRGPDELPDDEPGDVEIFTGVRARSLRFGVVPETDVRFEGDPGQRSSAKEVRENLPDEVEPGRSYRNVTVRWTARSKVDDPAENGNSRPPRSD
jgi:hypothetical protein